MFCWQISQILTGVCVHSTALLSVRFGSTSSPGNVHLDLLSLTWWLHFSRNILETAWPHLCCVSYTLSFCPTVFCAFSLKEQLFVGKRKSIRKKYVGRSVNHICTRVQLQRTVTLVQKARLVPVLFDGFRYFWSVKSLKREQLNRTH